MEVRAAAPKEEADSGKMIIEGRAVVFDNKTVLFKYDDIEYSEVIEKGALDEADMTDVFLKYNHSDNFMVLARTRNKSLTLDLRDDGLYVSAELADTTEGRDLYALVKRGDIDKMSFAFTIREESYDNQTHTWTVRKIDKLYDVAAVPVPAYQDTELYARRFGDVETRQREVETLELAKAKVRVKLEIEKNL
jgi:HK97 family phage prohead protease